MSSFQDMDPQEAANYAEEGPSQQDPERETAAASDDSVISRLFDGEADGPSVKEIERQYDLPRWLALTLRGILRAAPGRGLPPIGDIALGGGLGLRKMQTAQNSAEEPESETENSETNGGPAQEATVTVNE